MRYNHPPFAMLLFALAECSASIVYLQETKREAFDSDYLKNFYPRCLDKFEFSPSVGASRGLLSFGIQDGIMVLWYMSILTP